MLTFKLVVVIILTLILTSTCVGLWIEHREKKEARSQDVWNSSQAYWNSLDVRTPLLEWVLNINGAQKITIEYVADEWVVRWRIPLLTGDVLQWAPCADYFSDWDSAVCGARAMYERHYQRCITECYDVLDRYPLMDENRKLLA